ALEYQLKTDIKRLSKLLEVELTIDSPLPEEFVSQKITEILSESDLLRKQRELDPKLIKLKVELSSATSNTQTAKSRWEDAKETAEALTEEIEIAKGNKEEAD